jgi:hypothetical protein
LVRTCECQRNHDKFIWQQNIVYLDWKHKKANWQLHKNLAISIWSWALHHSKHVFDFQEANEINEIQVPFILGIQTPMQCQFMLTNDHIEQFPQITHLTQMMWKTFVHLMNFDAHHTRVLLAWIITSRQIVYDWSNGLNLWKRGCR